MSCIGTELCLAVLGSACELRAAAPGFTNILSSVGNSRVAVWGRGLCPTEVNSRALTGPAPTGFCYLLKILGNKKQRGFVSNSQGKKLSKSSIQTL